jgi:small ligand-binding sensory domain FIST
MMTPMAEFEAVSCEVSGPYKTENILQAARHVRTVLAKPARMAFAFVSANYVSHLSELCETLRVDGHILDVVGCTAGGRIEGEREFEGGSGCAILALQGSFGDPVSLQAESLLGGASCNGWIVLANPFVFPIDDWLKSLNFRPSGIPLVGGLASGGSEEETSVFINGKIVDAVAVPLTGRTSVLPVFSQGCRPIGEPLTVTNAEANVVYAVGNQPAYQVLERAFQTLSDEEKSNARGNLFAGLAGSEYVDDFQSGDFLIKNIIGADPNSGAVIIGGIPRIGQTLQYQLRHRQAAVEELARAFAPARSTKKRVYAALLFSCLGRGEQFFGERNRDVSSLIAAIGNKPLAGFFCNGEIAPVRGVNALHGNTVAAAVFTEQDS